MGLGGGGVRLRKGVQPYSLGGLYLDLKPGALGGQETLCSGWFRTSAPVWMCFVSNDLDGFVCDVIDLALRMIIWFNVVRRTERCSAFELYSIASSTVNPSQCDPNHVATL